MLASELAAAGHLVRGTTRDPGRMAEIEAVGAAAAVADPDRVGTLIGAFEQVSAVVILLGSAEGSAGQLAELHGPRLEMLLTKLVDTTVRGVVYESRGSVAAELLDAGARRVEAFASDSHARFALLDADPNDPIAWTLAAREGVDRVLSASI
jgi:hypothetical protein